LGEDHCMCIQCRNMNHIQQNEAPDTFGHVDGHRRDRMLPHLQAGRQKERDIVRKPKCGNYCYCYAFRISPSDARSLFIYMYTHSGLEN
jgi:arginyl-tRNA--protein-N-Asp/Glu arginylyltransferase